MDTHDSRRSNARGPRTVVALLTIVGLAGTLVLTTAPIASAMPAQVAAPVAPTVAAVTVAFTAAPTTAVPGNTFAIEPKVTVTGSADSAAVVTLSLVPVTVGAAGVLSCNSTTGTPAVTSATPTGGVATFTGCSVDRGGQYALRAAIAGVTVDSATLTVAGPEFANQPNGGVAGQAWTGQPEVRIVGDDGAPITADPTQNVGLVIMPGTGTLGATLTCTTNPMSAVAGSATFAGCSIDRAGTGYQLLAAAEGGTAFGTSAPFDITAGSPARLAFTTQPSGSTAGANLVVQPVVTVQDTYGNKVSASSAVVTLGITTNTGAALTCTANPVNAVNGVATIAGCKIDKVGSYTLTASSTGLTQGVSSTVTIAAGGATAISFSTSPGGGPGGSAFNVQPIVRLRDAGGNNVAGSVTLSIKPGTGAPGAVLTCTNNPAVGSGSQIAFTGCEIDRANPPGNPYVLVAASGPLLAVSQAFEVSIGSPHAARFLASPTVAIGGEAFRIQPRVEVRDDGGNFAGGSVTLALSPGLGRAGAMLACTEGTTATVVGGVATFAGCTIDQAGPDYRLIATIGTIGGTPTVSDTSPAFAVEVGAAHHLAFTTSPGAGTGGTAFVVQPAVVVQDLGGNTIFDSPATISLEVTEGTGTGTLGCTANSLHVTAGAALFAGCSIDTTGTGYTLTANAGALEGVSAPFDVAVGAPVGLEFSRQPGGATVGATFQSQPQVTVVDAGGNGVPLGEPVVLSLTTGTGTVGATLVCASASVVPSGDGVASFTGCSIGEAGGGFAVTAAWDGVTAESLPFPVLRSVAPALEQAPTGAPLAQTFGGAVYAINPTSVVNDVNTATGSLRYTVSDLAVVGVGMDLLLDRTYNSRDTSGGSFGRGWTSIFDLSVTQNSTGTTATVRGEDGQQLLFTRASSTANWDAPPGAQADLKCTAKTCTVTRWDGVSWTVTGPRLDNYLDANGQGLSFTYPTATTTVVRVATTDNKVTLNVTVTRSGALVTKVATPTRQVNYKYTAGLLTSVTDVLGKTWTYGYTSNRLTTVTDPDREQRLVVAYDSVTGRVTAASAKGGPRHTDDRYSYDTATQQSTRFARTFVGTSVIDAPFVDSYRNNVLIRQQLPNGDTLRYSYDNRLNLITVQDPTGFVQERTFSAAGDLIAQTSPLSSTSAAVVAFTYDNVHRMVGVTDANGNTTTYTYDGPNLGSIVTAGPSAGVTKLSYDQRGQLTQMTTPIGRQRFTYDAAGNESTVLETELSGAPINGAGTLATYDEAGNRSSLVDARGTTRGTPAAFKTQSQYDAAGHLLKTTDPLGSVTTFVYDGAGDIVRSTSPAGTTTYTWSEGTRTRTTVAPADTSTQHFDPSGNLLVERSMTGGETRHRFDALSREIETVDPAGSVTRYTYDAGGQVVFATADDGSVLRRQYDAMNRMIRSATDSTVTLMRYDLVGNTIQTGDGTGAVTTYTYDTHNKVTTLTDAAGTTSYEYDLADNVLRRVDGRGGVTTYSYNGMSRVGSMTVDGKTTTYSYDETGNVVRTTDPAGRITTLTLDARNRATGTRYEMPGASAIVVGQTFDVRDRRTSMTDSTGTYRYEYDAKGNLIRAGTPGGTFAYDRTTPGVTTETYPDGTTVDYRLDDAGALMGLDATSSDGDVTASYIRDLERRTTGVALGNGVLETRGYDAAGNVVGQSVQRFGTVLAGDSYTYDANGNRLTQRTTGAGRSVANAYAYDATGRVSGFRTSSTVVTAPSAIPTIGSSADTTDGQVPTLAGPGSFDLSTPLPEGTPTDAIAPAAADWSYDAVGNRTTTGAATVNYGAGDRITGQSGTTWAYDDSGAVTRISGPTGTRSFTYDAAARLVAAVVTESGNTSTITYTYDGDGNRISRIVDGVTTKYTWDPIGKLPLLVLERDGSGDVQRRYFYGEGPVAMQTPTDTFYFHLDPLGSTNQVTDQNGDVVAAFDYEAFGIVNEVGPAAGQIDLLFQAQQFDRTTGLYNMRARNYDPSSGRFTQREPVPTPVGVPVVSAYSFVANRPTVFTDPTGLVIRPSTLQPQVSENADAAFDAKIATTTTQLSIKGGSKILAYAATVGKTAAEVSASAGTAAAKTSAARIKAAGIGLSIIAIGLQTYIAYERCTNGPVEGCVAAVVSLAISVGFTVGCTFITSGAGAGACAFVGAMLSVAFDWIITERGVAIAQAFVDAYDLVVAVGTIVYDFALPIVTAALDAITAEYDSAVGNLVSGFNDATAAISSGFQAALAGLAEAGYQAEQIANLLRDSFEIAARDTVAALVNLGYDIQATAEALAATFALEASKAAQLLKDGFNAAAADVAAALESAYDITAAGVASALKDAEYAVSEVATAIEDTYDIAASEVAGFLEDAGYQFDQIAGALTDGLNVALAELDGALDQVEHTVVQVSAAFKDLYDLTAAAAATALREAGYLADQVASALSGVYVEAAAAAAQILAGVGFAADEVADALKDAYAATAAAVTQFLKDAGYVIDDIAGALADAFGTAATEAAAFFRNVGYTIVEIAGALQSAFDQLDAGAARILNEVGYLAGEVAVALEGAYGTTVEAISGLLADAGFLAGEVAVALNQVYGASAAAVTQFLKDAGYLVNDIAGALQDAFNIAATELARYLKFVGYTVDEIVDVLVDVFGQAAAETAAILNAIGVLASDIAGVLEGTFNQGIEAVGGILLSIGLSSSTISDIGTAFEDFGSDVEDFFSGLF